MLKFTKMQGCGNDYIYINCFEQQIDDPSALSIALSKRGHAVGSDGLILVCPSDVADAKMRIFNADGSEAKMCGNGVRCVGKFIYDKGIATKDTVTVDTLSGIKTLSVSAKDGKAYALTVDMGKASIDPKALPVLSETPLVNSLIKVKGQTHRVTCVSMGNPHCVLFCDDIANLDLRAEGIPFEHSSLFPESVNTEFVKVLERNLLEMRVWERGSGETLACGTGACAVAVAATLCGYCDKGADITVRLRGGELVINYTDERVLMTGPAVTVYEGIIE